MWCSSSRLEAACDGRVGRHILVRTFGQMCPQQQENARCLVPSAYRAVFDKLIAERARCGGWDGTTCIFAQTAAGGPANLQKQRAACLFCDPPRLSETCSTVTGRGRVLACIRRMATTSRDAAVARVPEDHRGFFVGALAEIPGTALGARRANRKRPAVAVDWNAALARRRHHRAPPSAALNTFYRKQVLDDRARARRRFGIPGRAARGATGVNDTGLPPPKRARSELAADLYDWCEKRSWGMCAECYSLLPLTLSEATLKGQGRDSPYVSSKQCPCCRATVRCAAPVPEEVPEALRGLTEESLQALAHLRLDVGPEIRASNNSGYRQHATMARFFWQSSSTSTRIRAIQDQAQRQLARNAKKYLMRAPECAYSRFEVEHQAFLASHPDPDERTCRRRLQFIETPGLETSLWPHLFYKDSLCLTVVRSTDARRVGRARGPTLEAFVRGDADSDTDDAAEADGRRHSVKRAYSALALSAHLGYGSRYDVLHFAYDLNLWSALGAKKTTSREYDVPMRVLMKGHSFSPLYWRGVHCALLDMVRQLGYPKIFWTISPYEWSMPYHVWLRDEMAKELRGRLHLAVAESLHVTHVLLQVVRGVLAGRTGHASRDPWQRHLLQAVGSDGEVHPVHVFLRVEFQDGTRKAPTQDYHGSGRPHIHVLVFASTEAIQCMPLPETVSATMPVAMDALDILPGLVRGSQLDRTGRSGWPEHTGPSGWNPATGGLQLRHMPEDQSMGLRPYFVALMEALRCHQDFQFADNDGALRAYVAKYVSKFSDSNQDEWLNDAAEGDSIAATVLCRYKPLEPEMTLQMFGARFRQWFVTTEGRGKRDFIVPWPEKPEQPREVEQYVAARWAAGRISLLDFLRKTTCEGKICAWLKRHHATDSRGLSLEDFAANYVVRGEKLVAADMLSRLNDKFYGQWLMLHVPFRDPEDFHVPVAAALDRIPAEHRNFAMVVLCEHPTAKAMWRTDAGALEAELRMEALSRPFVTTLLAMATAHRELVHKYLTGAADVRSEERRRNRLRAPPDTDQDTGTAFNAEQRHLQAKLTAAVERALAVQQTVTEADADELLQEAYDQGKIFVCTGGPGTGKTTTALAAVRRTLNLGGEVLFTYPTNRQASRMRAKLPATVAVDTFHAAFALDEPPGAVLPALARYALIVVDEISQLQQPHFEHICKLWNQADNLPAILMAGDELQMAGFGPTRAWHSPLWRRMIYRVKLHKTYRCKDPAFNRILQELRTSRPGANTLKWLRGRKAWAPPQSPSVDGIRKLLKAHPDTVVLTCTRRGAQTINDLALRALFPRHDPLAVLPADVESNSKNYQDGALLQDLSALEPLPLPIFRGMRVVFTRNVRKDVDFVNGMDGQVVAYNARSKAVEVVTTTQHRVVVWPWTDPDLGNLTYYPLKAGYADTIVKFQGAELTHVTAYLDCPGVPGAAYTALSRVSYGKDILIGGAVTAAHFQPVDEARDG